MAFKIITGKGTLESIKCLGCLVVAPIMIALVCSYLVVWFLFCEEK